MSILFKADEDAVLVPPRRYSSHAKPRHETVHIRDALRVIERASTPGTGELPTSLCTQGVAAKGYWIPKSRQDDPFLQKLLAAKNLSLHNRLPYRDAYLYQHGVLPDQYKPPRDDRLVNLHPCDKVDARLPESLRMMEARNQLVKGRASSSRRNEVLPWDGTMKNVTSSLLWREREPLF